MEKRGLHTRSKTGSHIPQRVPVMKVFPSAPEEKDRKTERVGNMRILERALQAAWTVKPENDPEGLWRRGWVQGWLTCAQQNGKISLRDARMIALGLNAGLEIHPRHLLNESEWNNWAQLWAMIWTQSWMKQREEMQAENITPLRPEALADRVLAAAVRLIKSLTE